METIGIYNVQIRETRLSGLLTLRFPPIWGNSRWHQSGACDLSSPQHSCHDGQENRGQGVVPRNYRDDTGIPKPELTIGGPDVKLAPLSPGWLKEAKAARKRTNQNQQAWDRGVGTVHHFHVP